MSAQAQPPIYIDDSIGLLNIDTSDPTLSPHIVLLSSMKTVGQPITIRDSFGSASDTNVIMISTIEDVHFAKEGGPGSNLYTITQSYGSITVTPQHTQPTTTSTSWKAVNTFSFPDSTRAATIHLTKVSTLVAGGLDVAQTNVLNTTISSIYTTFLGITNTRDFSVNISSSTLHRGLFSTSGAIYAGGLVSTMSSLSVGGNASILQTTTIGGTLKAFTGTSLIGNVGVCTSPNSSNALFVSGTQSNTGAVYLGNTLAVASDTTVGGKASVTGNTTLQGTLQITKGTSLLQSVGIGAENTTTTTLLVTGTQSTLGAVSLGDTLEVTSNTNIQGTLQVAKGTTFSASVGIGAANTTANTLLVTGTQSNTGSIGIAGKLDVTGNTTLNGILYMPYATNFTAPMGIGAANTTANALLVTGSEGITQNLYVGRNLIVNPGTAYFPTTAITGALTLQGRPVGSSSANIIHDYFIVPNPTNSPYSFTPKSKKCIVTIVGGGGGGGAGSSGYQSASGGGGGGSGFRTTFMIEYADLTNAEFKYTIGAGGAGGSVSQGNSPGYNLGTIAYNTIGIYTPTSSTYNNRNCSIPRNGSNTVFYASGNLLNNGLGGTTPVNITVGGGGAGWNAATGDNQGLGGNGGTGFCGGGGGNPVGQGATGGLPGLGIVPSQNGYNTGVNNTYGTSAAGQGGAPATMPMASISQIPDWNSTIISAYGSTTNGAGQQGWGGAVFIGGSIAGGGGGGPGGGNGGTHTYCQVDSTTGQYIPTTAVTKGLYDPNDPGYPNKAGIPFRSPVAKTWPGYAGSPGILGGGGGGGGSIYYGAYPGDGGKGGDGYIEITWL